MTDSGWVKLWRKSLESGLMQNPELWMFWCWCLLKASHKPCKQMIGWQMVELQPGQFVFGRKKAATELPLSEQTIRTCLKKLERLGNLTIKATNKFSMITIVNWDSYQGINQQDNQQSNQQPTSSQPAANHKQECKNVKNEKKNTYTNEFESFWQAYPRKVGKAAAFKAWKSKNGTRPPADELVEIVEKHKQSTQWNREGGQYIPNPATWINQERWEDDLSCHEPQIIGPEDW